MREWLLAQWRETLSKPARRRKVDLRAAPTCGSWPGPTDPQTLARPQGEAHTGPLTIASRLAAPHRRHADMAAEDQPHTRGLHLTERVTLAGLVCSLPRGCAERLG